MRVSTAWWSAAACTVIVATGAWARPVDESAPCAKDGTVSVSNVAGSVRIETHDAAEVRVTGTADEDVEEVSVRADGGDVKIEVKLPRRHHGRGGEADLVVKVPTGAAVVVETVSASIEVTGAGNDLDLQSVSGGVTVRDTEGDADISTVSGALDLSGVRGALDLESVSGRIAVEVDGGKIDAETTSGEIRVHGGALEHVDCTSVSGDIEISGTPRRGKEAAEISVENFSGGIRLELPESVGAELSVETFSGTIRSDFGGAVERERMGPGASLEDSWGDGSARVDLSTFSGSVDVRKAGKKK